MCTERSLKVHQKYNSPLPGKYEDQTDDDRVYADLQVGSLNVLLNVH
jgi:hypothetical protein